MRPKRGQGWINDIVIMKKVHQFRCNSKFSASAGVVGAWTRDQKVSIDFTIFKEVFTGKNFNSRRKIGC